MPSPSGPIVIDGFKLGSLAICSLGTDAKTAAPNSCASFPALATSALDARDADHADIVSTQMYTDGYLAGPIDVTGDDTPPPDHAPKTEAFIYVFVFTLADGSVHATGVECPESGTSCEGIEAYPEPPPTESPK